MLAISLKEGEKVFIEIGGVTLEVILGKRIYGKQRLLFNGPRSVQIHRGNFKQKQDEHDEKETTQGQG